MPKTSNKTNQKEFLFKLSPLEPSIDAAWYVINTYSGHEYKAIEALKTRIKTMGLEDQIFQAIIPIQTKNPIDIYSYQQSNLEYKIKTLGYLKDLSKLNQYQFGLITISKDKLRSNSFSAKHLTYISYGLPVFCPEWRRDPLLKSATIYYNENNFESQFKKYSQKKFWDQLHQSTLKLAQKLNWNQTLLPILSIIYQIQSQKRQ